MKRLTLDILDNLGNGKAKIITCNRETEAGDYLLGEVKEVIKGKINNCLFFDFYPEKYPDRNILGRLAGIIDFYKDNRAVVLIHDLFFFHYPKAIINVFYSGGHVISFHSSWNEKKMAPYNFSERRMRHEGVNISRTNNFPREEDETKFFKTSIREWNRPKNSEEIL